VRVAIGGGCGISCSLRELTEVCRVVTGQEVALTTEDSVRPGDIPWYVTDSRRGRVLFGWEPRRSLRELIGDLYGWIEANREVLRPVLAPGPVA